jgi:hypothetical protein
VTIYKTAEPFDAWDCVEPATPAEQFYDRMKGVTLISSLHCPQCHDATVGRIAKGKVLLMYGLGKLQQPAPNKPGLWLFFFGPPGELRVGEAADLRRTPPRGRAIVNGSARCFDLFAREVSGGFDGDTYVALCPKGRHSPIVFDGAPLAAVVDRFARKGRQRVAGTVADEHRTRR